MSKDVVGIPLYQSLRLPYYWHLRAMSPHTKATAARINTIIEDQTYGFIGWVHVHTDIKLYADQARNVTLNHATRASRIRRYARYIERNMPVWKVAYRLTGEYR